MILFKDKVTGNWIAEDDNHTAIATTRKEAFRLLLVMLRIARQTD